MSLTTIPADEEISNQLPSYISNNTREKIEPDQVSLSNIHFAEQSRRRRKYSLNDVKTKRLPKPSPRYALLLHWTPEILHFEIGERPIEKKIYVCNPCGRPVYVHCCGLWDESARLGASWRCLPRTRFFLAPGISAEIHIQAIPHDKPLIPSAYSALQLAVGHMRDVVVAHFQVTMEIDFLCYDPTPYGE